MAIALLGGNALVSCLQFFGLIYLLLSGIGFIGIDLKIEEQWETVIQLNFINYIQLIFGIALYVTGRLLEKYQRQVYA